MYTNLICTVLYYPVLYCTNTKLPYRFKNPKTGMDDACNGIDSVEGCSMKFMTKEAS